MAVPLPGIAGPAKDMRIVAPVWRARVRADRSVNSPVMIWIFGGKEDEEEDWEREWMCAGSLEGLRQKIVKVLEELLLLLLLLLDWRAVSRKMRPDGPFWGVIGLTVSFRYLPCRYNVS